MRITYNVSGITYKLESSLQLSGIIRDTKYEILRTEFANA